jgi:CelD/BcsL family acetyltransferase involved in cellulose biosynthesis
MLRCGCFGVDCCGYLPIADPPIRPVHPCSMLGRLTAWVHSVPRVSIYSSAWEFEKLRSRWESICIAGQATIFQDFDWNLLAAKIFAHREAPFVVCAEASYGIAIIPAVRRCSDGSLRLLGEELFDYRNFLHNGDELVLRAALSALAQTQGALEVVAVQESERKSVMEELDLLPFTVAPSVNCAETSAEQFAEMHNRLGRNFRRFRKLGFDFKTYHGDSSELLRDIYTWKTAQDSASLFHDPGRVEFIVQAARMAPQCCEIFALERGPRLAAALVTWRDGDFRRFYTGWFDPEYGKLSPAMTLIYEVTRQSLASGLNSDYMTGEQPYKLRLATSSMPLYRLHATSEQLAALSETVAA